MRKSNKTLIILGTLLGIVIIVIVYQLAMRFTGVPGQLYRYYPASTGFYLELAPGEKLTRQFVTFLEAQTAREENTQQANLPVLAEQSGHPATKPTTQTKAGPPNPAEKSVLTEPGSSSGVIGLPSEQTSAIEKTQSAGTSATQPKQKSFRQLFLQKFHSTFEPYFSLGIWPDETATPSRPQANSGHVLVVFPLKENLSLAEIVQRFDLDTKDFTHQNHENFSYLEEKSSGTSLAVLNQKLMITNTSPAMQSALKHYRKNGPNVYEEPQNKTYLSQLPWFRQGTFILNNSVYTRRALEGKNNQITDALARMGDILPLTVGAIQAKQEQLLSVRFLTPIVLTNIPDTRLRASVQNLFLTTETFPHAKQLPMDTGFMIGVAGLDRVYDFYHDFMMPPDTERWMKTLEIILSGFRLDLRKDLIGLMEKRAVIATRTGIERSLIVITDKNELKDRNLDKISSLLATNTFPLKQQTKQISDWSVKTISLPMPLSKKPEDILSYGTVGTALVFAAPQDFVETARVADHEQKSLAESPLYQTVMSDMPNQSNLWLYVHVKEHTHPIQSQKHSSAKSAPQWIDALGMTLWAIPRQQGEVGLLHGQLNLKVTPLKN